MKATIENDKGEKFEVLVNQKTFSTGSKGFYANGKYEFEGKRYQISVTMVEIGSKPKP